MTRPLHSLDIAGSSGAVFRVTDGASRCVATGMHRLVCELPQGIYTVNATLGQSVETRQVVLDQPLSISLHSKVPSFGDRAFALAPAVLAAIGTRRFRPGGQLIALRGPWSGEHMDDTGVTLERDGASVPPLREGFVGDPGRPGVWHWQLFDLGPAAPADRSHVLTVTRSVCERAAPAAAGVAEAAPPPTPERVSHVLPQWGDRTVWAAYPATSCGAAERADLPLGYYLRLRLTQPGAAPAMALQCLSDQIFTTLAARTSLPLTKPVLDLLFGTGDSDPLLALGAAHVAALTLGLLGRLGRLGRLPHDASADPGASAELQLIDAELLHKRVRAWLDRRKGVPPAGSPDMVAVRLLFGIDTPVDLRGPPVLLRSLDGLIAALESDPAQSKAHAFDHGAWGLRMQVSDTFAFIQWEPDADYRQQLEDSIRRSLEAAQAQQSTVRLIEAAKATVEREKRTGGIAGILSEASAFAADRLRLESTPGAGARRVAAGLRQAEEPPAIDMAAFVRNNAAHLRIPASAVAHFSSALESLQLDRRSIQTTLAEWVHEPRKD